MRFWNNNMTDDILRRIASSFSNQSRLSTLEITSNLLTTRSLEIFSSIFKENRHLKNLLLHHNMIGEGANVKEAMSGFLESFLCELKSPEVLDLSYNLIGDESLYPIVKYLFANTECRISMLNLEHNLFTNYAKRTLA
jgi:Ran GTPase-activating protein (RanGAP) involved in mRNA processing and transport